MDPGIEVPSSSLVVLAAFVWFVCLTFCPARVCAQQAIMTDILALSDEGGSEVSEHSFQLEMSAEEVDGAEAENANAVDGASAGGSGPASNSHVSVLSSASALARIRLEEEEQRLRVIEARRAVARRRLRPAARRASPGS